MHHLSTPLFVFSFFYVLYLPPVPTSPPSAGGWGRGGHKIYYQSVFVCVCVLMPRGVSNTKRTSLSDLPHLLSRQVLSPPGGEVSSSLCLSVTLSLSLPRLFYTQTVCTDVPLSPDPECPLQRRLSGRGVSGIIHSAVTDDAEEQGQRWLCCHVKSSTAFGVTLFSFLILHH